MITMIREINAPRLFIEALWKVRNCGVSEPSRNGPVYRIPGPVLLEMEQPYERVLFDPIRDANPFFHIMEFVWMMAGSRDVRFIEEYNKQMRQYAEDDTNMVYAAYGYRWMKHMGDQVSAVVKHLLEHPTSRRAVLDMWCATCDQGFDKKDHPCNTHAYFQLGSNGLDMTVCNRSNDLVWGMLGANIVHMTFLHELIATACKMKVGTYRVFTVNLHFYKDLYKNGKQLLSRTEIVDPYDEEVHPRAVIDHPNDFPIFLKCCEQIVETRKTIQTKLPFFQELVFPVMRAWDAWKMGEPTEAMCYIEEIGYTDWQLACELWLERRL